MGLLAFGTLKSRRGFVSIPSIPTLFRRLASAAMDPSWLLVSFASAIPFSFSFFVTGFAYSLVITLVFVNVKRTIYSHHTMLTGSSYTWDEGDQGHKTAKAPWLGVRKLGDEVRPKGWTG